MAQADTDLGLRGVFRLILCEGIHFPEVKAAMDESPPQPRTMLSAYLQRQMDLQLVRRLDPEATSHSFMGVFSGVAIFDDLRRDGATAKELTDHFVDISVRGTAMPLAVVASEDRPEPAEAGRN